MMAGATRPMPSASATASPGDQSPACPERPPLLYRLTGALVRLALRLYFSDIHIERSDRLPASGPLLIAANHPSSVADAVVLGIVTRRVVHYLAHAGLFRSPLRRRFLLSCGVIPVHRRHGSESVAARNRESFAASTAVLEGGGVIGIFPEGTSHQQQNVTRLRTGTARIALEAEVRHDFALGVRIVPIGMNFESLTRFRTRVLVNVGRPMVVADYRAGYAENQPETVRRLTADLQARIERLIINISDVDLADLIHDLREIYLSDLRQHVRQQLPAEQQLPGRSAGDFVLRRAISDAVQWLHLHDPARLERLSYNVRTYRRQLRRYELADRFLRDERRPAAARRAMLDLLRAAVVAIGGLPGAVIGTVGNVVPYLATELCGRWLAPDLTKVTTTHLLAGAVAFVAWYAFLLVRFQAVFGTLIAALVVGLLPSTGLFTLWYLRRVRYHARHARFLYLAWVESQEIGKLRETRRSVLAEIDRVRDEILAADDTPAADNQRPSDP